MNTAQSIVAPQPADARSDARRWPVLVKTIVTVTILGLLFSRVDIGGCAGAMGQSIGVWLVVAFCTSVLALIFSTCKWDALLRALGVAASWWTLCKIYTIGFFASSCLPGVVGGDVVRCQLAGPHAGGRLKVAATILVERAVGVAALVLMCLAALVWDADRLATWPVLTLLGLISVALIGGVVVALNRRLATGTMYAARRWRIRPLVRIFYSLHRTLRTFPRSSLAVALGYSFLFYLGCGLKMYFICAAFETTITMPQATMVLLFVCLLTLVPISLGGLGLRQAGDVYMFGVFGLDVEQALGISLVHQLINYGYVALGGILFLRWRSFRTSPAA